MNTGFETDEGLVGGSAYDAHGESISDADMEKALAADAVMFGAVGGPKWDDVPYDNVRKPACCACARTWSCLPICARRSVIRRWPQSSSLKPEVVEGLDILIVRELTGGVYFGEPKEDHRSRQRPETRHRYAGLRHLSRSSAFPASPLNWRARGRTRSARWKSAMS